MGKLLPTSIQQNNRRHGCVNEDAPICDSQSCCGAECRSISCNDDHHHKVSSTTSQSQPQSIEPQQDNEDIKELLIIGAGPHALSLMLRLMEPDPDLLSDKERHHRAESTKRLRPRKDVYRHLKDLSRGPSVVYKASKICLKHRPTSKPSSLPIPPPSLSLDDMLKTVSVVDSNGSWLTSWRQNFQEIGIKELRSLMNAHADPYDHRALEFWAEMNGRDEELVTLPDLMQRDKKFKGPYQVPSTSLFHDFHELLVKAYGIDGIVQKGTVASITPMQQSDNPRDAVFQVAIKSGDTGLTKTIKAKRVVCAMGSNFSCHSALWSECLLHCKSAQDKILQPNEIVPWLSRNAKLGDEVFSTKKRLLIVGGGITSAQLTLLACRSSWCQSVTLIQRSKSMSRHFDLENKWMGPERGKLLTEFLSMNMQNRFCTLRSARKGGSIPPHLLRQLYRQAEQYPSKCCVKEEVEVLHVHEDGGSIFVTLDDGSEEAEYDMVWLSTGSANHIDRFAPLTSLRKKLPIDVVNGLPVLNRDLNWCCTSDDINNNDETREHYANKKEVHLDADEEEWMEAARKRFWCMGPLAGLQLGPDALNLVGARQGAVQIAKAIRIDMCDNDNNVHN